MCGSTAPVSRPYNLTVQDIENAVRAQNAEIPSGRIESLDREFTVVSKTALQTPEEFENIVVKEADGFQVRMNQVARVEVAAADERRSATYNGETSISLGVVKQATANPLDVAANVRKALDDLAPTLPTGMSSFVGYDTSVFIAESIDSVYETIFEAVILVVLVIFVFLRTLRASFIPVVTIPISLITSFAIMLMLGFSINTLTLLAMVLAIGLVVDDAIVMLENIYRHIEDGKSPFQGAIDGSKEITFAVIAMTLTLAAVYAPVGFAEGRTGKLFLEFALTLAGTVVVSGFVALTLTPMLCSKLLRHETKETRLQRWLRLRLDEIDAGYKDLLARALARQRVVVGVALGVALSCGGLFMLLQQELAPFEDRGTLLVVGQAPQGATLEFSQRYARQLESIYVDIPEVAGYLVVSGFPQITDLISFSRLVPWGERTGHSRKSFRRCSRSSTASRGSWRLRSTHRLWVRAAARSRSSMSSRHRVPMKSSRNM